MAVETAKTVRLKQGLWCDIGRHIMAQHFPFVTTATGLNACVECYEKNGDRVDWPDLHDSTAEAGSWE